jgi:hypothetical protein
MDRNCDKLEVEAFSFSRFFKLRNLAFFNTVEKLVKFKNLKVLDFSCPDEIIEGNGGEIAKPSLLKYTKLFEHFKKLEELCIYNWCPIIKAILDIHKFCSKLKVIHVDDDAKVSDSFQRFLDCKKIRLVRRSDRAKYFQNKKQLNFTPYWACEPEFLEAALSNLCLMKSLEYLNFSCPRQRLFENQGRSLSCYVYVFKHLPNLKILYAYNWYIDGEAAYKLCKYCTNLHTVCSSGELSVTWEAKKIFYKNNVRLV